MGSNVDSDKFVQKLAAGKAALETGWTKPLEDQHYQLMQEIAGLEERLAFSEQEAIPCAYAAKRVFDVDTTSTIQVDLAQTGQLPITLTDMYYVVKDGVTYDIPIVIPGPGAFCAEKIVVSCFHKYYSDEEKRYVEKNITGIQQTAIFNYTVKFSAAPCQWTWDATAASSEPIEIGAPKESTSVFEASYLGLNYFWNLVDSKSGARLADDLLSQHALLQRSVEISKTTNLYQRPPLSYGDGAFFEFDVPMVFERDGQANFMFRPITPFLQKADCQNPSSVVVQVELHGYRVNKAQDYLRVGALSR